MTPEIVEPNIAEPKTGPRIDPPRAHPPQSARPKKKRSIWPWVLLLIAAGAAAYYYPRLSQQTAQEPMKKSGGKGGDGRAVPVVAAAARRGDMPVYLDGLGSVTGVQYGYRANARGRRNDKVAFTEGQFVKEGDLLVQIDPRPFQVQLEQAEAQMAHDEALLANAQARSGALQGAARAGRDSQAAAGYAGRHGGAICRRPSRPTRPPSTTPSCTWCTAHITSPLTGRIGLRLVDQGNIVHATDANGLAVITQLQPIAVIFNIAEDSLPQVTKKMAAGETLTVMAYDRDLKKQAGDRNAADHRQPDRPDHRHGAIQGGFRKQRHVAVSQSVRECAAAARHQAQRGDHSDGGDPAQPAIDFVYVVKEDNTAEVRNITTTLTEGDEAAVDKGLEPGDMVVIDGIDKLQQGTKVNVELAGGRGLKPVSGEKPGDCMSPSRPFILRPVATSLLMAGLLLVGAVAYKQLPVSALPQVDYPTIQVVTFYPGASPDVMASSVTAPLERQFGQVPGLNQMTSTSSSGASVITLQFALDLNIDVAEQQVQAAINAAANVPADGSAQSADLQQDQSGRRADSDAGADLENHAAYRRWRISPTRGWRRKFRSCPASGWSASAAGRSRRCASRPIRWRCPPIT